MNAIETRPRVVNVVASTQFAKKLDLCTVVEKLAGSEYDPERFPGLIYRLSDPKTAILLFGSGKANCTGGESLEEARRAIRKVAALLNKSGISVDSDPEINIQNMVAVYYVGCALNLSNLIVSLGLENTEYEPEQFPGLVYKLINPNATFLLFSNGKLVCTGTKNRKELETAKKQLLKNLKAAIRKIKK